MQETTSSLKILKSTWGISIQLTALHKESNLVSSKYFITDRIGLNNNLIGIRLSEKEIIMLISGLRWVSEEIENKIEGNKSIVIELVKLELADTDFQEEGLYYGIAKWASDHFHFSLPHYSVNFDKKDNKYIFPEIDLNLRS